MLHHVLRNAPFLAAALLTASAVPLAQGQAQAQASTHTLSLVSATETTDAAGRLITVATVNGDISGVLTMAVTVDPSGAIQKGEWALNASYTAFGPPEADGDGDPQEFLTQLGVLKGTVSGGSAGVGPDGLAAYLNGLTLQLAGGTMTFANASKGTGTLSASNLTQSATGTLTLTF